VPDRILPERPNLEQYRKQAKELLRDAVAGVAAALNRLRKHHPQFHNLAPQNQPLITLADAQFVLAREHGYESWSKFAKHIETVRVIRDVEELDDPLNAFIEFACVDRHGWHGSGTLEHAQMILARYPKVSTANIYSATVLGDEATVREWLARDVSLATATGGPHNWDALTYLCFSRYLRIDKTRSASFVATARVLLEAGASADTGWIEYIDDPPRPVTESAIYGAAALAQNPGLTKLLLDFGANPNDEETAYHAAETYDNAVLEILLESGGFNQSSLATVAARKCDWHDEKGLGLALEHGADPNYMTHWKYSPLHQSIRRDNGLVMIEMLLDHGANPYLSNNQNGRNAIQMAGHHGRGDIIETLERRGYDIKLDGFDRMIAVCARGDLEAARSMAARDAELLAQLLSMGGTLLAHFSGANNAPGVRCLLALGVPASAMWREGDPYWELTHDSTALHVAAWRAHHELVSTLIAAGVPINARDARNRTALQLAVKACTDSYWKYRRQPDSVAALLAAGAITDGINRPTGYEAIDELLFARKTPISG
jgi:ankyrin repeat protein